VVEVVYNDASRRPDPSTFSKFELWHTDVGKLFSGIPKLSQSNLPTGLLRGSTPQHYVTKGSHLPRIWRGYHLELRVRFYGFSLAQYLTCRFCSCSYALYSSLSPGFQKYIEGLTALHSAVAQADGARAAGLPVRREPIESVHPVVRVHPVTGFKSVYVNPGTYVSSGICVLLFR
jgi:sulfonate dioxygenase